MKLWISLKEIIPHLKAFFQKFRHIAKWKATTMGHIQRHNLTESKVLTR
ncbi:MAG: hypothetical protein AABW49_01285 [Nanoarchaeota archaeon]